jgi:outer membrane protein TolC
LIPLLCAACVLPALASAQTTLTLDDAMRRAQSATPEARALAAGSLEAAERVRQARAGYLPRIDVVESIQRGDHPVFVFSSLLAQRRFAAGNFAVGALNRPGALTNIRTGVTVDQTVFDGGQSRLGVRRAELGAERAEVVREAASQDLALGAAERFVRVLQLEAFDRAHGAAIDAASSDLARVRDRRDAGLVTSADVLALEVHLAQVRQRQITTSGELEVARIELGMPSVRRPTNGSCSCRPPICRYRPTWRHSCAWRSTSGRRVRARGSPHGWPRTPGNRPRRRCCRASTCRADGS